ncbi:MAG: hypothetical protein REI96_18635 [Flavobacterium nitrogenifigens]|uniref:hypothetical protein n=1 Tax=Flavobacterium nitrogenifigens TaxID=1617283 RepID=UPI0028073A43|nr:hypothetical protein [Flavobacterium nitrogenifigens]MDQ8014472.1 hypothetical protein [Flavobacterium nitrogenifigens]
MYTLYYLNRNLQIGTIKAETLDAPILIPEDLVFSDLRKGINFIKEPHECISFTDVERLIIQSQFNDVELVKQADFRRANTYLIPSCPIDPVYLAFDFKPKIHLYEGTQHLSIVDTDDTGLQALFSVDGITFPERFTFDFDYWHSPEGDAQDGDVFGGIAYDLEAGHILIAFHLDMKFRDDVGNSNSIPNFKSMYFKNKTTGHISHTYDLTSFYL